MEKSEILYSYRSRIFFQKMMTAMVGLVWQGKNWESETVHLIANIRVDATYSIRTTLHYRRKQCYVYLFFCFHNHVLTSLWRLWGNVFFRFPTHNRELVLKIWWDRKSLFALQFFFLPHGMANVPNARGGRDDDNIFALEFFSFGQINGHFDRGTTRWPYQ